MEKNTEMLINSCSLAMAANIEVSSTSTETERNVSESVEPSSTSTAVETNVDESVGTLFDAAMMQLKQAFLDCGYGCDT